MRNVAVAHPGYSGRGGAEKVATETARALDAPIVTDVAGNTTPPDVEVIDFHLSAKDRLLRRSPVPTVMASARWWSDPNVLEEYDTVVCTGLASSWYRPHPTQRVIHYVHAEQRLAGDMWRSDATGVKRWAARLMSSTARTQRLRADVTIANSELTARQVRRHRPGCDPKIIYPPVDKHRAREPSSGGGVVYLGRVAEDKGVTGIISALGPTDVPLHIFGDGRLQSLCRHQSSSVDNVTIHGRVSGAEKWQWLADADALVLNTKCEHFGIVMAEALASGTPILTNGTGYPAEHIRHTVGDIGSVYETDDQLRRFAKAAVDGTLGDADDCVQAASGFGTDRFHREMRHAVGLVTPDPAVKTREKVVADD